MISAYYEGLVSLYVCLNMVCDCEALAIQFQLLSVNTLVSYAEFMRFSAGLVNRRNITFD